MKVRLVDQGQAVDVVGGVETSRFVARHGVESVGDVTECVRPKRRGHLSLK